MRFTHTFAGAREVSSIGFDTMTGFAILLVEGKLWRLEPSNPEAPVEMPVKGKITAPIVAVDAGVVLYAQGRSLYRLNLATYESELLAEMPRKIDHIAARQIERVYVACAADLYRISVPAVPTGRPRTQQ